MKMRLIFQTIVVLLWSLSSVVKAQESVQVSNARKEGRVVLYTSGNMPMIQAVAKAFEKKYPFLEVPMTRTSGENLVNKIRAESQGGKILFDVVYGTTMPFIANLNVLQPYSSPEDKFYAAKFKDAKGLWTGVSSNYYVLGYNTRRVSRQEAPRDWSNLLDPKWKGRLAMDPEDFAWLGAMEEYFGEQKAKSLMTALARQDIQWRKSHTQIAQFLAAGEFDLALMYAHTAEDMKKKAAPLEWVRTTKPVVVEIQSVAISARPQSPNGAKLLKDFFLSEEGQKIIFEQGKIPIRSGIVPETSPLQPAGLELHPISPKIFEGLNQYASKFDQLFGTRR